ncbi:MAG: hypothetical protein EP345_04485 [Sphingomonadales bacterium]|nr:MAG: hypothetical protein EP345_04485 [Sphingomonadales bacterium]
MVRPFLVRLHRYAGLALAFFLIVAGASGAVIAFTDEIDTALNPGLRLARPGSAVVSAYDVIDRIQADDPRGRVTFAQLAAIPGRASLSLNREHRTTAPSAIIRSMLIRVRARSWASGIGGRSRWIDAISCRGSTKSIIAFFFPPGFLDGFLA